MEVRKLLVKGVISNSKPEYGDYISGVFTRDKNDNTKRLILNLKNLDQSVKYKHFIISIIEPEVFMAPIDLKHAFFSVPIYEDQPKCLHTK